MEAPRLDGGPLHSMPLEATVIIPTHDHGPMLLHSARSALAQTVEEIELFIVGDGVPEVTREIVSELKRDERVRFFDHPKGPRHGEIYRHAALQEARGEIVCYLSDDDLCFPEHVACMRRLLSSADFAHALPRIHRRTRGDLLLRRRSHRTRLPRVFAIRNQLRSAVVRGAYHRDVQKASSPLGAGMSRDGRHPSDRAQPSAFFAPRPASCRPAHRARKVEPRPARPRVARRLRSSSARQACSNPSRRDDEAERGDRGPPTAARPASSLDPAWRRSAGGFRIWSTRRRQSRAGSCSPSSVA